MFRFRVHLNHTTVYVWKACGGLGVSEYMGTAGIDWHITSLIGIKSLGPVVQMMDISTIHHINHYPVDSAIGVWRNALAWENSQHYCDVTNGFPHDITAMPPLGFNMKISCLRNEERNIPFWWYVTRSGRSSSLVCNSALVPEISFWGETRGGVAKCWLFSDANELPQGFNTNQK